MKKAAFSIPMVKRTCLRIIKEYLLELNAKLARVIVPNPRARRHGMCDLNSKLRDPPLTAPLSSEIKQFID